MGLISIIDGVIEFANGIRTYLTKKDDQNTGRKLELGDEQKASVQGDVDAQRTEENNSGLTHQQLVDSLRNPASHK